MVKYLKSESTYIPIGIQAPKLIKNFKVTLNKTRLYNGDNTI